MKIRKFVVGMAASALALSMTVMSASAFNVGLYYQSDGTWDFRDAYNPEAEEGFEVATFPNKGVGVQGGGSGFDTNAAFEDAEVTKDGTYTVTGVLSGTINNNPQKYDDGTERSGDALNWAVAANTEIGDDGTAVDGTPFAGFNLLGLTSDLVDGVEYTDDGYVTVDGKTIKITDVTITYGGNTFTLADTFSDSTGNSANWTFINNWAKKKTKEEMIGAGRMIDKADTAAAVPGKTDTISVTFTVSGLGGGDSTTVTLKHVEKKEATAAAEGNIEYWYDEANDEYYSDAEGKNEIKKEDTVIAKTGDSKTDSSSSKTDSSSKANTSSTASSSSTSSAASDNTNAATGATAGIALAGLAVAGAVAVVSKRK